MSRVYGTDEKGEPLLLRLECDHPGCAAVLKPGPHAADSGWTKHGTAGSLVLEWHYCPEHSPP